MEALLPQHIIIGPFYLNTESIRTAVAKKHRDVARALLGFLAKKLRNDADLVCESVKYFLGVQIISCDFVNHIDSFCEVLVLTF